MEHFSRGAHIVTNAGKWDNWVDYIREMVYVWRIHLSRRWKRRTHQLQKIPHDNAQTCNHLFASVALVLETERRFCRGSRLHRSAADVRWLFKCTAVWERDQAVTNISSTSELHFAGSMSIPDRFALSWQPTLGKNHRTVPSHRLYEE